jgi:hypothetical protein
MSKKHTKYGAVGFHAAASQISRFAQRHPGDKRQTLSQELKSSGSIDNPVKYTETHLKGGIEDEI